MAAPLPKSTGNISFGGDLDRLLQAIGYAYVLRVPLLLFVAGVFLTAGGLLPNGPAASIVRGIYDVGLPSDPGPNLVRFLFLTFTALAFGATLSMSSWTILTCAHDRFGHVRIPDTAGTRLACVLPPLLLAATIIGGCALGCEQKGWALAGIAAGCAVFAVFLLLGRALQRPSTIEALSKSRAVALIKDGLPSVETAVQFLWALSTSLKFLVDRIPGDPSGYVAPDGRPRERHRFAASLATTSLVAYVIMWILKSNATNPGSFGEYPLFPTLALVLLLGILIGWTFAGITFFLDRYRVPIVVPIALYATFTSSFPQSDHFYSALARPKGYRYVALPPARLLAGGTSRRHIVIAATGGGIQAAAWTARVLRELQWTAQQRRLDFAPSVRMISSVSGGSVGAMYFLDAYLPSPGANCGPQVASIDNDCVIRAAEASSLDEVAAGLVYEDLTLDLVPFVKGIGWRPLRLVNGRGLMADRGNALENAFKRLPGVDAPLLQWKEDARRGVRPAVIFNATMVENGERLLFSTTDLEDASRCERPLDADSVRSVLATAQRNGRVDFHSLYCISDVAVATAARLSATFPFVSPAARIFEGDLHWPSDHVVDGGYTDNYGMASLVEWLDQGLAAAPDAGPVMVVEIRAGHAAPESAPGNERGFLFQTLHPATTLLEARDTGQFSRDQLEMALLRERYQGRVCSAVFQYAPPPDERKAPPEPLSWHLTPGDLNRLRGAWVLQQGPAEKVMRYLEGGSCHD